MTPDQIAIWRQSLALAKELSEELTRPPLIVELARFVENEMFRQVNLRLARRWIAENLAPARRPYQLGIGSLKHIYERDGARGRYIKASDFARLLKEAGYKFTADGRVYAREVRHGT